MPRNNQSVPKAERQAAVVAEAIELFKTHGYRSTSVAAVGKAAGLVPAAVHWYYPTKDDLFAAALESIFMDARRRIESNRRTAKDPYLELCSFLELLAPYRSLHREAYERINDSDALRRVYEAIQDWLEGRFLAIVEQHAPPGADHERMTEVAHFLFEGLLVSVRRIDHSAEYYIDLAVSAVIGAGATKPIRG